MKKTIVLGALVLSAAAGYAQESRQDVSISGFETINPIVHGNDVTLTPTHTTGVLAAYRYLLTPRSAAELNYTFAQYTNYFQYGGELTYNPIHTRQQELSLAYVYGRSYHNYNPFVEVGIAGVNFAPIKDQGTSQLSAASKTNIGGLFGAGLAYEISPSFDIRAQYRGVVVKAPNFSLPNNIFNTGRYELLSEPSIGVAYHF